MKDRPDYKQIPSVDRLQEIPAIERLKSRCDSSLITDLIRDAVGAIREEISSGESNGATREGLIERITDDVRNRLDLILDPHLKRVINGTGIVLHTNLGRAPIPRVAVDRITEVAGRYSNLELDLESGGRGSRTGIVEDLLCRLTGAEAAAVVNNNAAAVFLALNTLSLGKEAIVSRGQLVEIGGSFRIPDIMGRSGALMVEVGTTNRTHLRDYEDAIQSETGVILAVHPSNYQVLGFTAEVQIEELVALGNRRGVPVLQDLGGGILVDLRDYGLPYEPLVSESIKFGVDVATFSGDKILGGPQAGILVGQKEAIERIRQNPLMRALRCGKLTYSALEATLALFLKPDSLIKEHPTLRMMTESVATLRRRGRALLRKLGGAKELHLDLVDSVAQTGSGALPLEEIPSVALCLSCSAFSVGALAAGIRSYETPVLGYVREDRMYLDLRTISGDELGTVADAIHWSLSRLREA